MQELRFVRSDDGALIAANESGDHYRVVVDEALVAEVKRLSRKPSEGARVKPREIQSLVRAGKSREEIAQLTGAEPADIERFEGPVLAERQFILESAHKVPVVSRGQDAEEPQETFGEAIALRLSGLSADTHEWTAWREEERGWLIGLEFISHDVAHHALWSFEHRKGVLTPLNDDAVRLSKQGEIGDRLIPKLRAVDVPERTERFDSGAFAPEELPAAVRHPAVGPVDPVEEAPTEQIPAVEAPEPVDPAREYERRQHIDQRAMTRSEEAADLGQTADLLDALRRRRGEREHENEDTPLDWGDDTPDVGEEPLPAPQEAPPTLREVPPAPPAAEPPAPRARTLTRVPEPPAEPAQEKPAKKRRAEIPSWDDILFGTRSDEDPV